LALAEKYYDHNILNMGTKGEQTHQSIVESAARMVRGRGIIGTRVADVMEGAGLTVGGFYAHFASKAELINEALRHRGVVLRDRLFRQLDDKPAADRASVVLNRYLSTRNRDDETEGCPLPAVVGEVGTVEPAHRDVLQGEVEALVERLAEQVNGARGLSRRQLALAIVALMYGGLGLARAFRGSELSDEVLKVCRTVGALVVRAAKE
jgi:TetR/AcrR family transcriptional repressor of nem operon